MRSYDLACRSCRRPPGGSRGFSLLEALVVVAVLGIAAVVGIPSLIGQMARLRLESTATNVANLMLQTRMRAIRDNSQYTVAISGGKVSGMAAFGDDPIDLEPEDPVAIYQAGDGAAVCLNRYDGTGSFDAESVVYQGTGLATGTGAICVHDRRGNVLQIVVRFPTAQPKIRKYLAAGNSPTGDEGFFEKTGFNPVTGAANVWTWY